MAGAILSFYGVGISLARIRSKLKGSPPEAPVPVAEPTVAATSSDTIPSVESPDFEKFINDDDALGKFVESEERMMKWIDTLSKE